jgi:hypothetical protein
LVDIDRDKLRYKVSQYLNSSISNSQIEALYPGIMKPVARYNSLSIRAELLGKGFREWQIRRFLYRPFDLRFVYWEPDTKLLNEKRSDYVAGMFGNQSLILPKQNRITYAGPCVTRELCDINSVDGGASVFSDVQVDWNPFAGASIESNLSPSVTLWMEKSGVPPERLASHPSAHRC